MCRIQVVWFENLQIWSVALQNAKPITSKFNLVRLNEVLVDLTKTRAFVIKDDEFYKEPTISSKTNLITPRKEGFGREFKVKKRVLILPNDLVVAKMHTQNGLYAFAKETFASTNTFVPFEIKENKINRDFLFIVLKPTLQRLQKFDSVNRETYTTDEILNLQIPLPPLEKQREIVASLQDLQDKIAAKEAEQNALKERIESHIYGALGLQKQSQAPKQRVFVVNFKDLERWDLRHNQNQVRHFERSEKSTRLLSEICHINPSVDMKEFIKRDENASFIPMEALSTDGRTFKTISKKAALCKGFTKFQNGDLLWAKITPCMQNKKSAVVSGLENGVGFGSTEFFVVRAKDLNEVDINFILQFLRTNFVIEQAKSHFKGSAGQQRVPKEFLENFKIPLPPLEIQRKIVQEIENLQSQISALNDEIAKHENAKQTLTHNLLW